MKKLVVVLIALVAITGIWAGADLVQADEEDTGPIHRVFEGLVADGVITEAQAEAVMHRLGPVLRELISGREHRIAHGVLEEAHERLHHGSEQDARHKRLRDAQFHQLLTLFGMEAAELRERLGHGTSIAAIGEELGFAVDEIASAMATPFTRLLRAQVEEGDITAEEARARLQGIKQDIRHRVLAAG
jgi:polyhydroxyalkanoate synthesis regulator phasin